MVDASMVGSRKNKWFQHQLKQNFVNLLPTIFKPIHEFQRKCKLHLFVIQFEIKNISSEDRIWTLKPYWKLPPIRPCISVLTLTKKSYFLNFDSWFRQIFDTFRKYIFRCRISIRNTLASKHAELYQAYLKIPLFSVNL